MDPRPRSGCYLGRGEPRRAAAEKMRARSIVPMVPRTTSHDHPKVRLAPRRVPARAADDTPGRRRGERGGDDRDGPDEPDPTRDTGDLEDDPQHLTGHQRERPREQAEHDSKREHGHARHAEVVAFGPSAGKKA